MLIVMNSPKQVQEAVNNAVSIHEAADGAEITYVGHSLGGMEAAAASMKTGDAAITFNPAAITDKIAGELGLGDASKVDNFVLRGATYSFMGLRISQGGDPLYNAQKAIGRTPPGNIINIYTGSYSMKHGIKHFGNLPRFWK